MCAYLSTGTKPFFTDTPRFNGARIAQWMCTFMHTRVSPQPPCTESRCFKLLTSRFIILTNTEIVISNFYEFYRFFATISRDSKVPVLLLFTNWLFFNFVIFDVFHRFIKLHSLWRQVIKWNLLCRETEQILPQKWCGQHCKIWRIWATRTFF
jgi:hypothetical protein